MTFDGTRNEPIAVFAPGGASDPTSCGTGQLETWALTSAGWNQVDTATPPPDCPVGAVAYDGANGQTVLVLAPQGETTQTWLFDGADWTQAQPADSPANVGPMAYDESLQQIVMVGRGSDPTWTWDGQNWTRAGDGPGLDPVTAAYSSTDGGVIAVGPDAGNPGGDQRTLTFDGSSWTDAQPQGALPPAGALAADAVSSRVVLLPAVGSDNSGASFEQWRWTGTSWKRTAPSVAPSAMSDLATSVDPGTGSIYVLGFPVGQDPASATPETWVYESSAVKRCGETPIDSQAAGVVATGIVADGTDCATARSIAAAAPATLGDTYPSNGFDCQTRPGLDPTTTQVFAYQCVSGDKTVRFAATG
jgi:hypothetical protein